MDVHGDLYGRANVAVNVDVRKARSTGDVYARGNQKAAGYGNGLIAWLTAPAPTACKFTGTPSLTMPAMAPATEAGDDLLETFRNSI
jgi:hypothetical protein